MRNPVIEEDLATIAASATEWSRFQGKTVLISGANGFLPAYLVESLLFQNELHRSNTWQPIHIIGLVRNMDRATARFAEYQGRHDLEIIEHDVNNPISISAPVDFIVHAASQASPKYYGIDPVGTLSANVIGTNNLLSLAQSKKVTSFLYISSGEVYGNIDPAQLPVKESYYGQVDPTDVRSCYAESKRMGETMCVSWFHQYGVPAKIARPFHTYGPGMRLDDGRVFADFVSDIVNNRDIVMQSDGSAIRAFCYLADATIGFFTVLLMGMAGEAYNIGNSDAEISIIGLAKTLAGLFPDKNLEVVQKVVPSRPGYIKSKITRSVPDTSKAGLLGWQPTVSIRDGFYRTIRSYA